MKTKILALDTSTDACSLAISSAGEVFVEEIIAPQAHAKLILGMIDAICQKSGLGLADLDAIAFGQGPGSFTGLRIAAAVAQGLAFGLGKPVIAVSSLQALALRAQVAILDARMGEIYHCIYGQQEFLNKPEDFRLADDQIYTAVGTGALAYKNILLDNNPNLIIDENILYPRAQEILELARTKFAGGDILTAAEAIPVYLRNKVAQKSKKNPD